VDEVSFAVVRRYA